MSAPERTEAEMVERIAAFEAAPAAPESWTGSQVAVDLRMAAAVLERDGWTQGDFFDDDSGCRCLAGAVVHAIQPRSYSDEQLNWDGDLDSKRYEQAILTVAENLNLQKRLGSVSKWNDVVGRTADEVIAALRAAADKADQA